MATYSIWVYQTSDLTGVPDEAFFGAAVGSPTFTIGVNSGANWIEIVVQDNDTVFEEGDSSQSLAQDVTINGVLYTAGTDIYSAYELSDSTSGHAITTIHIGNSSNGGYSERGPIQAIMSNGPMPAGATYTFNQEQTSYNNVEIPYEGDGHYICFGRGTFIQTPTGQVLIEDLNAGDKVVTQSSGTQTIRWIGSRAVSTTPKTAPIVISRGALGKLNGKHLPVQDLTVSPQHRMQVSNWRAELLFGEPSVLVAAKHLVDGDSIYVSPTRSVEYFHILFDRHEIVYANDAPSESFHPGEQGFGLMPEETRNEIFDLFPELQANIGQYGTLTQISLKAYEARALLAS